MTRVVGGVFRGAVVAWGVEHGRADFLRAGAQQHHLPDWRRFAEMRPIRH